MFSYYDNLRFCSIVAAQSLSRLLSPLLGYFSSFSKKPSSERAALAPTLPDFFLESAPDQSRQFGIRIGLTPAGIPCGDYSRRSPPFGCIQRGDEQGILAAEGRRHTGIDGFA